MSPVNVLVMKHVNNLVMSPVQTQSQQKMSDTPLYKMIGLSDVNRLVLAV